MTLLLALSFVLIVAQYLELRYLRGFYHMVYRASGTPGWMCDGDLEMRLRRGSEALGSRLAHGSPKTVEEGRRCCTPIVRIYNPEENCFEEYNEERH